jgi:alkanesulfonate monooxygenase SsuD/methylene tetrahydromethanopterin reductase-like flavin-dependent oxidoreductase (luciferase family)
MKSSLVLSVQSFQLLAPAARLAEAAGLDRVWVTETPGRDALIRGLHVATVTNSIQVGTGIAYAFTRHPIAMASAAIEAHAASGRRMTFAIGAGPVPIRAAVGADFSQPAKRLTEYVNYVRTAVRSHEGFDFSGEFYETHLSGFTSPDALDRPCDIYGSGLNRRVLTALAPIVDGISLHPLALYQPYLDSVVLQSVRSAATPGPKLACWCVTSIHPDPDRALRQARTRLGQYLSNRSFGAVLAGSEWESSLADVQSAGATGDWQAAGELIPPALVDELAVVGTPDEAPDRLKSLRDRLARRGIDELALQVAALGGPNEQILDDIRLIVDAAGLAASVTGPSDQDL